MRRWSHVLTALAALGVGVALAAQSITVDKATIGGKVYDSTAGIVQGTGITVTGTWPKQTVTGSAAGVTSVTCGSGMTGGTITSTGTCAVDVGTTTGKIAAGDDSRITGALPAALADGKLFVGSALGVATAVPLSGDCTIINTGEITCNPAAGAVTIVAPQGRLTLVSGQPVMTEDQVAKSTLYYDCHVGSGVPYYTGSDDAMDSIPSCEVSTAMQASSTGVLNSAGVFDVFWDAAHHEICVATDGSGGGWAADTGGSNTARGSGYSAVHNTRGFWTNTGTVAHCYNGATDYGSIAADRGTYLGSIYTTAAGKTGMALKPAAAAGGTANILGVWNAYNRVPVAAQSRDSTANWTCSSNTWQVANVGATGSGLNNRVSIVDGLQQSQIDASYIVSAQGSLNADGSVGVNLDSTSATPTVSAYFNGSAVISTMTVREIFLPKIGFHYIQAMNVFRTGSGMIFYGTTNTPQAQAITVQLMM